MQQNKTKQKPHAPNIKQTKIWHDFDLLVEKKKGEMSPVILILTKVSDFDT